MAASVHQVRYDQSTAYLELRGYLRDLDWKVHQDSERK